MGKKCQKTTERWIEKEKETIDWLILEARQLLKGYFISKNSLYVYIFIICIFFFLRAFFFLSPVLSNTNNFYFWLVDGKMTGTITLSQSGPGSNENEGRYQLA